MKTVLGRSWAFLGVLAIAVVACCVALSALLFGHTLPRESFLDERVDPIIIHGYPKIMQHLRSLDYADGRRIPRILFRTYIKPFTDLPKEAIDALKSSSSTPGSDPYHVLYFSDEDCRQFIREHCAEYLADFDVLVPGAYRADLWRLIALYEYGGVYNDIGHVYVSPVDTVINHDNDELVLTRDRPWGIGTPFPSSVHNAFMACYKNHPVIEYMLQWVVANIRRRHYGINQLDITGPIALARAFNTYFGKKEDTPVEPGLFEMRGHQIKIVSFDDETFTLSWSGVVFANVKFPNYRAIMYPEDGKAHYDVYFWDGNVYGEKANSV